MCFSRWGCGRTPGGPVGEAPSCPNATTVSRACAPLSKPLTCLLLTFTLVFLPDQDPDLAAIGLALVGLVLANLQVTGKVDCTFKNSFAR